MSSPRDVRDGPYGSFTDLYEVVTQLRASGDRSAAVSLVEKYRDSFSHHTGLMYLVQAELLAELGRPSGALGALDDALRAGCRYPPDALGSNKLAPVRELPGFAEVAERSKRQWDAAVASYPPQRTVLRPSRGSARGLLIVLHGNNSDAAETLPHWSAAIDHGWTVAVLQSSEPGTTPGSFTWNDRERTAAEVETHLAALKDDVGATLVLGGFSMGALQAIAIATTGRLRVSALVSVAAWLPHVREFTALAAEGKAKFVPSYVLVGQRDPSYDGAKQFVTLARAHGGQALLDERAGLGHSYPDDMATTVPRALRFIAGERS